MNTHASLTSCRWFTWGLCRSRALTDRWLFYRSTVLFGGCGLGRLCSACVRLPGFCILCCGSSSVSLESRPEVRLSPRHLVLCVRASSWHMHSISFKQQCAELSHVLLSFIETGQPQLISFLREAHLQYQSAWLPKTLLNLIVGSGFQPSRVFWKVCIIKEFFKVYSVMAYLPVCLFSTLTPFSVIIFCVITKIRLYWSGVGP